MTTKKNPKRGAMANAALSMGDDYLAMLDSTRTESTIDRVRRDRERHQATRPCPACQVPMVDGRCGEHGTPGEDGGAWLWSR